MTKKSDRCIRCSRPRSVILKSLCTCIAKCKHPACYPLTQP